MAYLDPQKISHLIVHCSATKPSVGVDASVIRRWHKLQGWSDIGYHYVIKRGGFVEPGRPIDQIGAHTKGWNDRSIGVCMVGGVHEKTGRAENNFTLDQFASLAEVIASARAHFPGITVLGHRDTFGDTNGDGVVDSRDWFKECPSFDVRKWMKETGVNE